MRVDSCGPLVMRELTRLDPVEISRGLIAGVETAARLTWRQMMFAAGERLSGKNPLRPGLGPEFALAIIWAEGALAVGTAGAEDRENIERFLNSARQGHNYNWISPKG